VSMMVDMLLSSEKDIEDDLYLVPCALYESAMVHLAVQRYTEAKDLLTRAKYRNLAFSAHRILLAFLSLKLDPTFVRLMASFTRA